MRACSLISFSTPISSNQLITCPSVCFVWKIRCIHRRHKHHNAFLRSCPHTQRKVCSTSDLKSILTSRVKCTSSSYDYYLERISHICYFAINSQYKLWKIQFIWKRDFLALLYLFYPIIVARISLAREVKDCWIYCLTCNSS